MLECPATMKPEGFIRKRQEFLKKFKCRVPEFCQQPFDFCGSLQVCTVAAGQGPEVAMFALLP